MDTGIFECERSLVEEVTQKHLKSVLLQEYCASSYSLIDLTNLYYTEIEGNAPLMFMIIFAVFPMLFVQLRHIAEKYLSEGMADLAFRMKMSPTIAAVSFIAFASGSPDILHSIHASHMKGGSFVSLGCTLGGYIFCSTLVIANVISASGGELRAPKFTMLKELGFYFLALVVICYFGYIQQLDWVFFIVFMTLYGLYWITTIIVDVREGKKQQSQRTLQIKPLIEEENNEQDINDEEQQNEQNNQEDEQQENKEDEQVNDDANQEGEQVNEEAKKEEEQKHNDDQVVVEMDDHNKEHAKEQHHTEDHGHGHGHHKPEGFLNQILFDIYPDHGSTYERLILIPLNVVENPLMDTPLKYLICAISTTFALYELDMTPYSLFILMIIGASVGFLTLVFETFNISKNIISIIYESISVFTAIALVSIFASIVVDFIAFQAFYFNISEIILNALLFSIGNCVGEYFGNAALAAKGEVLMATIASYSVQLFNNYVGFGINSLLFNLHGHPKFDLFGQNYYKGEGAENKPPPLGIYYVNGLIVVSFLLIFITFFYLITNDFIFNKKFINLMSFIYAVFFIVSILFAVLNTE